jgi:hypothetical protein
MRLALCCALWLVVSLPARAINPPAWEQFSAGEFVDAGNVKVDGEISAAYVKHAGTVTLYEVDCTGDRIRVHSDLPRYRAVRVQGGTSVVVMDDGFRTVVPGSHDARIEGAICGAAKRQADAAKERVQQAECERAKSDERLRALFAAKRLADDESACLLQITFGQRGPECRKALISDNMGVTEYLHSRGIFLPCEDRSNE